MCRVNTLPQGILRVYQYWYMQGSQSCCKCFSCASSACAASHTCGHLSGISSVSVCVDHNRWRGSMTRRGSVAAFCFYFKLYSTTVLLDLTWPTRWNSKRETPPPPPAACRLFRFPPPTRLCSHPARRKVSTDGNLTQWGREGEEGGGVAGFFVCSVWPLLASI